MDVRLGHGHDPHGVLFGLFQVDLDVTPGIDYHRLPGRLATYEVASLGQIVIVDSREKHFLIFSFVLTVLRFSGAHRGLSVFESLDHGTHVGARLVIGELRE